MSPKIRVLDDATINQIAAGEVIENPASVLKELLENALDAGATEIHIETLGGGRRLIRVSDNGCGMEREDAFLCLERHATSKIAQAGDLFSLSTLGFRGEALPSIASISKLSMQTAPISGGEGTALTVEGGKLLEWQPSSRMHGTTFEVHALFYNAPVRRKFQKTAQSDANEIRRQLTLGALSHPKVKFLWTHEGKKEWILPHASLEKLEEFGMRISTLFGDPFFGDLLPLEYQDAYGKMRGFIGKSSVHRPNRTGQYLFINHRAVASPMISALMLEGYGTRLPTHRFPLFLLHLFLPPDWIDVNVHPQKKEVRIREESWIRDFILGAMDQTFQRKAPPPSFAASSVVFEERPKSPFPFFVAEETTPEEVLLQCPWRILAVFEGYILVDKESLLIIDQRRAQERVFYEEMLKKINARALLPTQGLLFPLTLELNPLEAKEMEDQLEIFNKAGVSIRPFGKNAFLIDAVPQDVDEIRLMDILREDIGLLEKDREKRLLIQLTRSLRRKPVSVEGAEHLVEKLFQCQEPDISPLGKTIISSLTQDELEARFQ